VRGTVRSKLVQALERVIDSDEARRALLSVARPLAMNRPHELDLALNEIPYEGLAQLSSESATSLREDVVFITARFRTGSTLLWNLFRSLPELTAYYEPFNERRWFDPIARGSRVDHTHRQVGDYWREYEGLTELGNWYDESWTSRDLYMDQNAWLPGMKRYVEILIERAKGKPVLQFNRIDFRLPWFRRHFPNAKVVHLFRHPRDQWLSTIAEYADKCGVNCTVAAFGKYAAYYLVGWASDLATHFPMLAPEPSRHPYELFYLIWRLSYMFGRRFAGHSVCFERLLAEPDNELAALLDYVRLSANIDQLKTLLSPPEVGKWRSYADESWFLAIEERCECQLAEFFGANQPETVPA
jgi:hypothetical protein